MDRNLNLLSYTLKARLFTYWVYKIGLDYIGPFFIFPNNQKSCDIVLNVIIV